MTFNSIASDGQFLTHIPHPMHFFGSQVNMPRKRAGTGGRSKGYLSVTGGCTKEVRTSFSIVAMFIGADTPR
jgi:hypothetical protein